MSDQTQKPADNTTNTTTNQATNQQGSAAKMPNRFGTPSNNNNASNTTNNTSNPVNPLRPLSREQIEYALLPLRGVAIRFELKGLGDPFYRLLGHQLNTEYSDCRLVARDLEQGGADVDVLRSLMDEAWCRYGLKGAMIVYQLDNEHLLKQLNAPSMMPKKSVFDDDDETNDEPPKPAVKIWRAIDMMLVLNVLARARMQILLATSPVVFSQHYLNRSIVSDDPRLVALAMATGVV